jgi:hypothetical protein
MTEPFYAHSIPGKPPSEWQLLEGHVRNVAEMAELSAELLVARIDAVVPLWEIRSGWRAIPSSLVPLGRGSNYKSLAPLRLRPNGKKLSFRTSDAEHREIRNPEKPCDFKASWIPARAPLHGAWPG